MPEVLKLCHAAAFPNQSARDRLHASDEASFINDHILNVDAGKNH
ncbi:MAG: hypothetical protein WA397_18195 [Roseiarcus sp.]